MIRLLTFLFGAGAFGGFLNALASWFSGKLGIAAAVGLPSPGWDPVSIYRQTVWGGIWGLLFILPILNDQYVFKGFILSLAPTVVAWFVVLPAKIPNFKGTFSMFLLVVVLNAIWGVAAAYWLTHLRRSA